MIETMIKVKGLTKQYGNMFAVNGISFEVQKGEVFGLLGPNGAGKTTTLECLEGIRKPDSGELNIAGCNPLSDGRNLRRNLGVQLQSSSLPDGIRVDEAMSLVCAWHGVPVRFDLLKRFGINDFSKKQYHALSTGQKRRLHLALSLASNPKVVILDEPTAGLDVQGRAQLHDAIRNLKSEGITTLLATHDMAEAEMLCDHLAIMVKGEIAITGTPEQVTAVGNTETRIVIRTKNNSLLPGRDIGSARFIKVTEEYVEWVCSDVATSVMDILKQVQAAGDTTEDLRVQKPSLEERFLELVDRREHK